MRPLVAVLVVVALGLTAAPAGAVGVPEGYPRTIAIAGTGEGVRVERLQATFRVVDARRMRVTVRVAARAIGAARQVVLRVAPCTGGSSTSPTCPVRASATLRVTPTRLDTSRTFTVARPSSRRDAVRITLTRFGRKVTGVGGGAGTGELLFNGGQWRRGQGTAYGVEARPPAGIQVDRVWFNSRRYEWNAVSAQPATAVTTMGAVGRAPARRYTSPMTANVGRAFRRTPAFGSPFESRSALVLDYAATVGTSRLFTVRMPLPAWQS